MYIKSLSELIEYLENIKEEHGDIEVYKIFRERIEDFSEIISMVVMKKMDMVFFIRFMELVTTGTITVILQDPKGRGRLRGNTIKACRWTSWSLEK